MKKTIIILNILIFYVTAFSSFDVAFINPGKSDETFWVMVSDFMKASAEDLDINFEVQYAERNFLSAITIMKEIASRKEKPEYVVIVNEKLVAPRLLKIAEENDIKTFMILNDLTDEQKSEEGIPREKHQNWLGSLIPNNEEAGYMIADSLIKKTSQEKNQILKMIAIAGNRVTPASVQRVNGLRQSINENPNVQLLQILYAEWDQNEAYTITNGMFNRYDNIDMIWAVSDPTALGALTAIKEEGKKAGKDVFVSGLNWSNEALEKIKTGEMVSSVGGHFMVGGWALVVLKDYYEGHDFLKEEHGTELKINIFGTIDSSNVDDYLKHFGDSNWNKIDFRKFSKHYNKNFQHYDFSLNKILEQFN